MKSFAITIRGDCPDSEPHAAILEAAARAERALNNGEFLVANVMTEIDVEVAEPEPEYDELEQIARQIIRRHYGSNRKIEAIKELRGADVGLGLKEAKDVIDRLWEAVGSTIPF